ncbi:MAG: hypothetical protein R2811_14400 [Flavobacteriales bacterium]
MLAARVQCRSGKYFEPRGVLPIPIRRIASLDRTSLRLVAEEVRGVHIEAFDRTGSTKLDHGNVVPFRAFPAALPAIHPLAAVGVLVGDEDGLAGLDQVLLLGEEVIGTPKDFATKTFGGEVDEVGEGGCSSLAPFQLSVPNNDQIIRAMKNQCFRTDINFIPP